MDELPYQALCWNCLNFSFNLQCLLFLNFLKVGILGSFILVFPSQWMPGNMTGRSASRRQSNQDFCQLVLFSSFPQSLPIQCTLLYQTDMQQVRPRIVQNILLNPTVHTKLFYCLSYQSCLMCPTSDTPTKLSFQIGLWLEMGKILQDC